MLTFMFCLMVIEATILSIIMVNNYIDKKAAEWEAMDERRNEAYLKVISNRLYDDI